MGVDDSPDIFQHKMNDLFHILVLIRGDCTDPVQKLELTQNKLKGKGLKCNIENSFFRLTKMEYLGLWLTRNVVKPMDKKYKQ